MAVVARGSPPSLGLVLAFVAGRRRRGRRFGSTPGLIVVVVAARRPGRRGQPPLRPRTRTAPRPSGPHAAGPGGPQPAPSHEARRATAEAAKRRERYCPLDPTDRRTEHRHEPVPRQGRRPAHLPARRGRPHRGVPDRASTARCGPWPRACARRTSQVRRPARAADPRRPPAVAGPRATSTSSTRSRWSRPSAPSARTSTACPSGMALLEVADQLAQERHPDPRLYAMLVGALRALADVDAADPDARWRPAFFLKALVLEGAGPVLDACAACGEPDGDGGAGRLRPRRGGHAVPGPPPRPAHERGRAGPAAPHPRRRPGGRAGAGRRPPGADEVAELATEAMEAHLDRRIRSVRSTRLAFDRAFGVYVHVPFCRERCDYCAFATYTDRDHLMERYVDALRRSSCSAPSATGGLAAATSASSSEGAPRRASTPDALCRILDAIPRRGRRRGDRRVQSRGRRRRAPRRLPAGRRDPGVLRPAVDQRRTCCAGLGRRHVPRCGRDASPLRSARGRLQHLEPRPHLRGRRPRATTTGPRTLDDVLGLDDPPPHVSAYALTVEPGTPLATDARPPSRRRRAGPALRAGRRRARARPATAGRRSPTGPARATSAGTTTSTGSRATTSASARPPTPTATGGAGGTCARPSATSTRSRQAGRPRAGARS